MKRVALLAAAALAAVTCALVAWHFRAVILLFALSLAVNAALRSRVDRQVRHGWPRPAALVAVYALTLGLGGLVLWVTAGPVLDDVRVLSDNFSLAYEAAWLAWPRGTAFQQTLAAWMPPPGDLYAAVMGPAGLAALQGLLGFTLNLFDFIGSAAIVLVLSLYWGMDQARAERLWLSVVPAEGRARAREVWRAIESGVGAYLRSEVAQSLLAGVLLGLGFWALGLRYPALLAALSALMWFVPWLGAALALGLVALAGLAQAPGLAILAGAYTVIIFFLLEFVVEPRLHNRRQHSALWVVLLMIVLGKAFGLAGVLVAPPLAAALHILVTNLMAAAPAAEAQPLTSAYQDLSARLAALRLQLDNGSQQPETEVHSLADRLQGLLDQAGEVLEGERRPVYAPGQRRSSSAVSSAAHGQ
jgi:predicted PurR-regulated permease PerM